MAVNGDLLQLTLLHDCLNADGPCTRNLKAEYNVGELLRAQCSAPILLQLVDLQHNVQVDVESVDVEVTHVQVDVHGVRDVTTAQRLNLWRGEACLSDLAASFISSEVMFGDERGTYRLRAQLDANDAMDFEGQMALPFFTFNEPFTVVDPAQQRFKRPAAWGPWATKGGGAPNLAWGWGSTWRSEL